MSRKQGVANCNGAHACTMELERMHACNEPYFYNFMCSLYSHV